MEKTLRIRLIVALFGLAAITGCAAPTVTTEVTVASQLSMTPDINPSLHAMPDWGDKIAVMPANKQNSKDPTYGQIKAGLESMLNLAHLEVVPKGHGEKYRLSVDWSVKPSRQIVAYETVPATVVGFGGGWGWGHPGFHHHYRGFGMGPSIAWVERPYTVQMYMRSLTVTLYEMNGSLAEDVFAATVRHEASCNQIQDIIPYMVHAAIDNLYAQNGTKTLVTVPETSDVCR